MRIDMYYLAHDTDNALRVAVAGEFRTLFSDQWHLHFVDSNDHLECLRRGLEDDCHMVIAEAGTRFDARTPDVLRRSVDALSGKSWDVVFGEIAFADAEEMLKIFPSKSEMLMRNNLHLHYLRKIEFTGTRLFAINKWSKHKVYDYLQKRPEDVPFDVFLPNAARAEELRAFVIYPFATEDASTAQGEVPRPDPAAPPFLDAAAVVAEWNTLFT